MKTCSLPNLNRETTSFPNFFTIIQEDQDPADPDDNDTTLNKRPKTNDTEPSVTSPFKGTLSTSLSSGEMNVNHHRIVGFFPEWDQMNWPPSPNGSDTNVSVGSNSFEDILCPFNSFDTEASAVSPFKDIVRSLRRHPLPIQRLFGEAFASRAKAGDDLRIKLLYLENRVGLAKLLFPMEAKRAMDIAQADGTFEFTLASINSKNMVGAQRITMDLNDAPFKIEDEYLNRLRALSKTVELGKCLFPRCSETLNQIMDDDDWSEQAYMQNETQQVCQLKERQYMELQDINKAFHEDKEDFCNCINIQSSSSSSSTSIGRVGRPNGKLTLQEIDADG